MPHVLWCQQTSLKPIIDSKKTDDHDISPSSIQNIDSTKPSCLEDGPFSLGTPSMFSGAKPTHDRKFPFP